MGDLEQKRDRMRRIFRGQESFGEGTAAEQAQRYRIDEIYDDAIEQAKLTSADVERPSVDLLISLSGFSPETTLLAYELVKPSELLIISSDETVASINTIWAKLAGRISFSNVRHVSCDPVDPTSIYDIVSKAVRPRSADDPPVRAIIDITGGKKVMSAGAALAASQLDLPMCYIDSIYDPEMRQALPGSEKLCVLPNPTRLFGDKDMTAAMAMFGGGIYAGAKARFAELSTSVSEPARARFMRDLSALYQAWCDLDVDGLPDPIAKMSDHLKDNRSAIRTETLGRLGEQLSFAESLAKRTGSALLLNFYLLGEHYYDMDRFDFAALLYYRTIEKAFEERLALTFGFDPAQPEYAKLATAVPALNEEFASATKEIYGTPSESLPRKVALMDAMVILSLAHDEMLSATGWNHGGAIKSMRGIVETRNRSVLAHGASSVSPQQCKELRGRAQAVLRAFLAIHEPNRNFDDYIATLRFVSEI